MTIIFDGTQGITTPAETANNSVTTPVVKSSANLVFQSNGTTEAMRITSGGNVGIGTTTPFSGNGTNLEVANGTIARLLLNQTGTRRISFGVGSNAFNIYDETADAERFKIDSSGRVTMPSQPFFYARKTVSQTIPTGTLVTFDAITTNIGSNYSTSTNRFTAPIAGVYSFSAKVWLNKNGAPYADFSPRVNGSLIPNSAGAYYDSSINSTGYANYLVSFQYYLNAADYVEFTVSTSGSGQTVVLDNSGYFCGFLLS